jgi:hypothetical protein
MKQEDKDHLLNDRGLSPEQQDDLRDFFDRLDLMGVDYQPLSVSLSDIMNISEFKYGCGIELDPTDPELLKIAKQDVKNILDLHIEFDIYIPSKFWVLNVNSEALKYTISSEHLAENTLHNSFCLFNGSQGSNYNHALLRYFIEHHPNRLKYPCIEGPRLKLETLVLVEQHKIPYQTNDQPLLWGKLQEKKYRSTKRDSEDKVVSDFHKFYEELDPIRFPKQQEKYFQQFLDNNPIWKEQYAKLAADFLLQSDKAQSVSSYPYAFQKAKAFVKAGNPHIDLNDIINSRISD